MNNSLSYVSVVGYGWTGSGVVVDLLKEFDEYDGLDIEFSIIWEPNGLLDLEKSLVNDWDFLRHDVAIRDFLSYCKLINSQNKFFNRRGMDLSNKLDVDFIQETNKFVNKLIDFQYIGETRIHNYKFTNIELFMKRLYKKILNKNIYKTNMYMSRPTKNTFLKEVKIYMDCIFENYAKKNNIKNIILDQSIPASNIMKTMKYFNNIKSIVVDRDPRDVYVNLINRKVLIGAECSLYNDMQSVDKFVKWHQILRKQDRIEENKEEILRLKFEDIILDYDNSLKIIIDFLRIETKHSYKNKFFKPAISGKKIGLWKTYPNQKEIDYIYNELKEYCYDI